MLTPDDLAAAALAVLDARGPLSEADLLAALLLAGHDPGRRPTDALADLLETGAGAALGELPDERLVGLPGLLAGRVLTHRLTAAEAAAGAVVLGLDLAPLTALLTEDARWAGGPALRPLLPGPDDEELAELGLAELSPVELVGGEVLPLPPGALGTAAAGELVGLRTGPDGWEVVAPGAVGAAPADLADRVAAVLPDGGAPALVESVTWALCAADPALLRTPLPPLTEALAAAGLVVADLWVAPAGTDVTGWLHEQQVVRVAEDHGLGADAAGAVLALLELHDEVAAGLVRPAGTAEEDAARRADLASAVAHLADPAVADAVLAEVALAVGTDTELEQADLEALAAIARSGEQVAPREARAGLRWLGARALELLGETAEAEAALESALTADEDWEPALLDLARYAADRGDVERALSLLRRAEVPADDELVALLEQFRARPRPDLGRNDRCWCGSGRKYKQCHLGREEVPLAERTGWLHAKALLFLDDGRWAQAVELLDAVHADALEDAGLEWSEDGDGFVPDVALAEGGGLGAFLAVRGELLPADERAAVADWVGARRSVHEVVALPAGDAVTLRDLRTGAEHVVSGGRRTGLRVGDTVTARLLPVAGELRAPGGVDVVAPGRGAALLVELDAEPTAAAVVRALTVATRADHPG